MEKGISNDEEPVLNGIEPYLKTESSVASYKL